MNTDTQLLDEQLKAFELEVKHSDCKVCKRLVNYTGDLLADYTDALSQIGQLKRDLEATKDSEQSALNECVRRRKEIAVLASRQLQQSFEEAHANA